MDSFDRCRSAPISSVYFYTTVPVCSADKMCSREVEYFAQGLIGETPDIKSQSINLQLIVQEVSLSNLCHSL